MLVSIIIPVYNEELTIGNVIERVQAVMAQSGLKYEIIVADDHSFDNSLASRKSDILSECTRLKRTWAKAWGSEQALPKQKAT